MNASDKPLEASLWLSLQALLSFEEMQELCHHLKPFHIVASGAIVEEGQEAIEIPCWLAFYKEYIDALSSGVCLEESTLRAPFSRAWSCDLTPFFGVAVQQQPKVRTLVRAASPIVQLQHCRIRYSSGDGKMHAMVLGRNTISWGLQWAFPQLYRDFPSGQIKKPRQENNNNSLFFSKLQRWLRTNSLPTTFWVSGKKIATSLRLGQQCLSWIDKHPQLAAQGITLRFPS